MDAITAETIEEAFNCGGGLELANGESLTHDGLVQYIEACEIDTDDDGTPLDNQWQILADVLGAPEPSNVAELVTVIAAANQLVAAEEKRDNAIRTALAAGYSAINVAAAANLSRARIYQIRDHRR